MRLVNVHTLSLNDVNEHDFSDKPPPYAILSHRWRRGTELSFDDLEQTRGYELLGYKKLSGACEFVKQRLPAVEWIWIDTCCIDRKSSAILTEAINSMFKYYRQAQICLTYMDDVNEVEDFASFSASDWFTRGWTLQELIAPVLVVFLTRDWQVIGHRPGTQSMPFNTGIDLTEQISTLTGIPHSVLTSFRAKQYSLEEISKWLDRRETTRGEDMTYCLLGLLDASMPVIYGEGQVAARRRLLATLHIDEAVDGKTAILPGLHIKFSQNTVSNYVERPGLSIQLEHLMTTVSTGGRCQHVAVVHGIGGSGKTQLVLRYVAVHEADFKLILWIDCRNQVTAYASYERYCAELQLTTSKTSHQADDDEAVQTVLRWLQSSQYRWLLVLDSLDDLTWDVNKIIPRGTSGSVIVTSQDSLVRQHFGRDAGQLKVDTMEPQEAANVLLSSVDPNERLSGIADRIASILDYHALALDLAIARITFDIEDGHAPEQAFTRYLDDLGAHRDEILRHDEYVGTAQYSKSLWSVWINTFATIKEIDRNRIVKAIDFLSLITQLDRANVQEELFRLAARGIRLTKAKLQVDLPAWVDLFLQSKPDGTWDDFHYRESSRMLLRFGLTNKTLGDYSGASMHSLIQWRALQELDTAEFRQMALTIVTAAATQVEDSVNFRRYLIQHIPNKDLTSLQLPDPSRAWLCMIIGRTLDLAGKWSEGTKLLEVAAELMGDEEDGDVEALAALATARRHQGRVREGKDLSQKVLDLQILRHGKDDMRTFDAMHELGIQLFELGRWADAEVLANQVVTQRSQVLGDNDLSTLASLLQLAEILEAQGHFLRAKRLLERVLSGRQKLLGKDHAETVEVSCALGVLLLRLGHIYETEKVLRSVLEIRTRLLGAAHPETFTIKLDLAYVLMYQGRYAMAKQQCEEARTDISTVLDTRHPMALQAKLCTAELLTAYEQYAEADAIIKETIQIYTEVLGPEHPQTLNGISSLAKSYQDQGRYDEAVISQERAVTMVRRLDQDTWLYEMLLRLAGMHSREENWAAAEPLQLEAYSIAVRLEELDFEDTTIVAVNTEAPLTLQRIAQRKFYRPLSLAAMQQLCQTYKHLGRHEDAKEYALRVMEYFKEVHGEHTAYTLEASGVIASLYVAQERWKDAEEAYETLYQEMIRVLGQKHDFTIDVAQELATAFVHNSRFEEAEKLLQEIRDTRTSCCGPRHYNTLTTTSQLAGVYAEAGRFEESRHMHESVVGTMREQFGLHHVWTIEAQEAYANSLAVEGDRVLELQLRKTILDARLLLHGKERLTSLDAVNQLFETYFDDSNWEMMQEMGPDLLEKTIALTGQWSEMSLRVMKLLALAYRHLKKYQDAITLHSKALEHWDMTEGRDHPEYINAQTALATTYRDDQQYEKSIALFESVLETRKRLSPTDEDLILTWTAAVAKTCRIAKQYAKAATIMEEVVARRSVVHERPHEKLSAAWHELVLSRLKQGRCIEGLHMEHMVLTDHLEMHGEEHGTTVAIIKNLRGFTRTAIRDGQNSHLEDGIIALQLADCDTPEAKLSALQALSRNYDLIRMWDRTLPIRHALVNASKEVHGMEHDATLSALDKVAVSLENLEQWDVAENIHRSCAVTRAQMYGLNSPASVTSLYYVGCCLLEQDKLEDAIEHLAKVVAEREAVLGLKDMETLKPLCRLAEAYDRMDQLEKAHQAYSRAYQPVVDILGIDAPETSNVRLSLADIAKQREDWETAIRYQKVILESLERTEGRTHELTLEAVAWLTMSYMKARITNQCSDLIARLLEAISDFEGNGYDTAVRSMWWLPMIAAISRDSGSSLLADTLGERARDLSLAALGANTLCQTDYIIYLGLIYRAREWWEDAAAVYSYALDQATKDRNRYDTVRLWEECSALEQERTMLDVD